MKALKVSEVNSYIKRLLSDDLILSDIQIEGEISNFNKHFSGHLYFSLKDEKSRIKCVMFKSDADNLALEPVEGQSIIAQGYISLYERGGDYQLYIKKIIDKGTGKLYKEFEELKKKLQEEGVFDDSHKKPLPFFPTKIGVVTSATGAVIRDIIKVAKRRYPASKILLYPSLVQGEYAPEELIRGLKYLDNREDIDVIIFGRGGGSMEELFAFNNEELARCIFSLKTPNISAVGHESDFTIADFVADIRASTPSVAAEMAVPDREYLLASLGDRKNSLNYLFDNYFSFKYKEVNDLFKDLKYKSPDNKIREDSQRLDSLLKDLLFSSRNLFNRKEQDLSNLEKRLNLLNPMISLEKGHGILSREDGRLVKSIKDIRDGELLKILMKDGRISARVEKLEEGDINGYK